MPVVNGQFSQNATYTDATTVASGGTRAAPSTSSDGMDLTDCTGFRVIISADSGQTLSGIGTVRIWLWSNFMNRWVHDSQLDYTLSFASATWRDDVSPDFVCTVGFGRVFPQVVGVTSSSGNITTQAEGGKLS